MIDQFVFSLLLECDNDQSDENVNKEEWKNDEIYDVE